VEVGCKGGTCAQQICRHHYRTHRDFPDEQRLFVMDLSGGTLALPTVAGFVAGAINAAAGGRPALHVSGADRDRVPAAGRLRHQQCHRPPRLCHGRLGLPRGAPRPAQADRAVCGGQRVRQLRGHRADPGQLAAGLRGHRAFPRPRLLRAVGRPARDRTQDRRANRPKWGPGFGALHFGGVVGLRTGIAPPPRRRPTTLGHQPRTECLPQGCMRIYDRSSVS
jgi:hypothetical protein